jgi:hypothetical protein
MSLLILKPLLRFKPKRLQREKKKTEQPGETRLPTWTHQMDTMQTKRARIQPVYLQNPRKRMGPSSVNTIFNVFLQALFEA